MIHNTQSAQVLQEQDKAGMGEHILWVLHCWEKGKCFDNS